MLLWLCFIIEAQGGLPSTAKGIALLHLENSDNLQAYTIDSNPTVPHKSIRGLFWREAGFGLLGGVIGSISGKTDENSVFHNAISKNIQDDDCFWQGNRYVGSRRTMYSGK